MADLSKKRTRALEAEMMGRKYIHLEPAHLPLLCTGGHRHVFEWARAQGRPYQLPELLEQLQALPTWAMSGGLLGQARVIILARFCSLLLQLCPFVYKACNFSYNGIITLVSKRHRSEHHRGVSRSKLKEY
jgi:hypothetical protein